MEGYKLFFAAIAICFATTYGQSSDCRKLLDIVLVVDGSDSISNPDFESIKSSLTRLINQLDIERDQIWLGLVLYSSNITEVINIQEDKQILLQRVSQLKHARMGTNTALAVETMNIILKAGREGVPKMGVVITDGLSLDPTATHIAAVNAISAGVDMFSVGIGRLVHYGELQGLATGPGFVLNFTDFDQMSLDVVEKAVSNICPDSECRGLLDLIAVVDGSDSITENDFNTLKSAILSLLDELTLGEDGVRFGLVLYSSNITTVLNLSSDKEQLKTEVVTLVHSRQGTNTHVGIKKMVEMFAQQGRGRIPKVGIVITDGISKQPNSTVADAAIAKDSGITMYAVGVTKRIDMTELKNIASSDEKSISLESFNQLKSGIGSLMKQVCPTTTTSTTASMKTTATPMPTPLPMTQSSVVTPLPPVDCITAGQNPSYPVDLDDAERDDIDSDTERDDDEFSHQLEFDDENNTPARHYNTQGLWNKLFGRHRAFTNYRTFDDDDRYPMRGYLLGQPSNFYNTYYDDK